MPRKSTCRKRRSARKRKTPRRKSCRKKSARKSCPRARKSKMQDIPQLKNRAICMATAAAIVRNSMQFGLARVTKDVKKNASLKNMCDAIGPAVTHRMEEKDNLIITLDGKDTYSIPATDHYHSQNETFALIKWIPANIQPNQVWWVKVGPDLAFVFTMEEPGANIKIDESGKITPTPKNMVLSSCDLLSEGGCPAAGKV